MVLWSTRKIGQAAAVRLCGKVPARWLEVVKWFTVAIDAVADCSGIWVAHAPKDDVRPAADATS